MGALDACQATSHDPRFRQHLLGRLREEGIVAISGVRDHAALPALTPGVLQSRPHREAGPDGVTVITAKGPSAASGYAAFTNSELVPHTDGSSQVRPPGLLVLACLQPAAKGGETTIADGKETVAALAASCPEMLIALCSPWAAVSAVPTATSDLPSPLQARAG